MKRWRFDGKREEEEWRFWGAEREEEEYWRLCPVEETLFCFFFVALVFTVFGRWTICSSWCWCCWCSLEFVVVADSYLLVYAGYCGNHVSQKVLDLKLLTLMLADQKCQTQHNVGLRICRAGPGLSQFKEWLLGWVQVWTPLCPNKMECEFEWHMLYSEMAMMV